ncbi:MAG TPA: DUF6785 family protein [Armatimonadaceae bacterium]|nr:DUF6785 family protein [Armatimonadaceae bacterium]
MATFSTPGDALHDGATGRGATPIAPDAAADGSRVGMRKGVVYGLGTLLLVLNAYFGTYAYVVVQALLWTQTSLLRGPVVVLALLVLLNGLFLKFARRSALNQHELLTLYAMLCLGTCSAGYGFVQILINQMAAPFYFKTGGNRWEELLIPHIPAWLAPRDPDVINGFFRGNSTLWDPVVLKGWAVPVLAWTGFIFAIFWTLLCATTLVRRQWVEEERLTFPLVLLPLEMTENGGATPFWKNRIMWAGFLVAGLLESANFINFLYPSFPTVPLKPSMGQNALHTFLTVRPWNTIGTLYLSFYPFAIGIGYLLALEVSFSCWFLYLMSKVAILACYALGLSEGGGSGPANRAPFIREQSVGAFIGIAVFSLWMARKALSQAWQEMQHPTGRDRDEVMSYRMAVIGGLVGLAFLVGFLIAAGFSPAMSAIFVFVYLCFSITLARIVSEAGAGWAWAPSWSPAAFTADSIGNTHLSAKHITMLHGYGSWLSDMRDNPMPQQVQSAKIAGQAGFSPRTFLGPLVFASLVGILLAFWAHLDIYYTYGAATAKVRPALANGATGPFRTAATLLVTPTLQDTVGLIAAGFGSALAIGLSVLRQQFTWWPFHPLGYALATTNSMEYMWFPFFLAWLAKKLTLQYGGIKAYRAALPFFLGLILGDYIVPTLWGVFGMLTGYQQYMSFPH